jgi:hypothetical protein
VFVRMGTFDARPGYLLIMMLLAAPACGGSDGAGPGADRGSLEVVTSTTGSDLDPDGYSLTVDGGRRRPSAPAIRS